MTSPDTVTVKLRSRLQGLWRSLSPGDDSPWNDVAPAWLVSLLVHLAILVTLTLVSGALQKAPDVLTLLIDPTPPEESLAISDQLSASDVAHESIGASVEGDSNAIVALSPNLGVAVAPPSQFEMDAAGPNVQRVEIQSEMRIATAPTFSDNVIIKGAAGVGATGASGAVDEITQEILNMLEQRRTLIVWLFDQSGSLAKQRAEINKRFDRIYEELGLIESAGNTAFKKHDNKPLLTAVVAFGQNISFLTSKPTDDVAEIKAKVAGIKTDDSGVERTFGAVHAAAERYRVFRAQEPRRNVMFVIFTDEAGDDEAEIDAAVNICRNLAIPVYCVGVPAPFGRTEALIKYVDPDPKFDQTPQWIPVRQGPESFQPELVKIGPVDGDAMDSGFGPYGLARLCYETNGIFYAVHPNRDERRTVSRRDTAVLSAQLSHFFDPELMRTYKPDYVSVKEYKRLLSQNRACQALVVAAQASQVTPMERPQLTFPKVSDADLANRLSQAQRAAAILEPKIDLLYRTLREGEKDRPKLTKLRWQAGYDLSMGRVLALKVRTEGYNAMLAKAKQSLKFEDPKDDTWLLRPSNEVTISSSLEKLAEQAKTYLQRVAQEHAGTPWALLAQQELQNPLGWAWKEAHTGVNEPKPRPPANNNAPRRPPQDDKAKMIARPPRRPAPKL